MFVKRLKVINNDTGYLGVREGWGVRFDLSFSSYMFMVLVVFKKKVS